MQGTRKSKSFWHYAIVEQSVTAYVESAACHVSKKQQCLCMIVRHPTLEKIKQKHETRGTMLDVSTRMTSF